MPDIQIPSSRDGVLQSIRFTAGEPKAPLVVFLHQWSGDYTIKDLSPVTAVVEFDQYGKFLSGEIQTADGETVAIRELTPHPFRARRDFTAKLRDTRDIEGTVEARICDEGRRIIGTWTDDLGNRGVFSFEKQAVDEQ